MPATSPGRVDAQFGSRARIRDASAERAPSHPERAARKASMSTVDVRVVTARRRQFSVGGNVAMSVDELPQISKRSVLAVQSSTS